jgi:F0F1-type ATP synthase assembly protein I
VSWSWLAGCLVGRMFGLFYDRSVGSVLWWLVRLGCLSGRLIDSVVG